MYFTNIFLSARPVVDHLAHYRATAKFPLRNCETCDDPYDSTSSDELDHINDQRANVFRPAIYRHQTTHAHTGQRSTTAAETTGPLKAPTPRRVVTATFL